MTQTTACVTNPAVCVTKTTASQLIHFQIHESPRRLSTRHPPTQPQPNQSPARRRGRGGGGYLGALLPVQAALRCNPPSHREEKRQRRRAPLRRKRLPPPGSTRRRGIRSLRCPGTRTPFVPESVLLLEMYTATRAGSTTPATQSCESPVNAREKTIRRSSTRRIRLCSLIRTARSPA
jgi:hypothetical protein